MVFRVTVTEITLFLFVVINQYTALDCVERGNQSTMGTKRRRRKKEAMKEPKSNCADSHEHHSWC